MQVYEVDNDLEYLGRTEVPNNPLKEKIKRALRPGTAKPQGEKETVKDAVKPTIKKELKQANQKIVKLDKQK